MPATYRSFSIAEVREDGGWKAWLLLLLPMPPRAKRMVAEENFIVLHADEMENYGSSLFLISVVFDGCEKFVEVPYALS